MQNFEDIKHLQPQYVRSDAHDTSSAVCKAKAVYYQKLADHYAAEALQRSSGSHNTHDVDVAPRAPPVSHPHRRPAVIRGSAGKGQPARRTNADAPAPRAPHTPDISTRPKSAPAKPARAQNIRGSVRLHLCDPETVRRRHRHPESPNRPKSPPVLRRDREQHRHPEPRQPCRRPRRSESPIRTPSLPTTSTSIRRISDDRPRLPVSHPTRKVVDHRRRENRSRSRPRRSRDRKQHKHPEPHQHPRAAPATTRAAPAQSCKLTLVR